MSSIAVAHTKYQRIAPRKCGLVADLIRRRDVGEALTILSFNKRQKASKIMLKTLRSAIANAQVKYPNVDVDSLYVAQVFVGKAPYLKRWQSAPHGRALPILKRYCHVSIYLEERKEK
jgi:large subunit ribosomal protein L22